MCLPDDTTEDLRLAKQLVDEALDVAIRIRTSVLDDEIQGGYGDEMAAASRLIGDLVIAQRTLAEL